MTRECWLITDDGQVAKKRTEDFLREFMSEFHRFIVRVYTVLPRILAQAG